MSGFRTTSGLASRLPVTYKLAPLPIISGLPFSIRLEVVDDARLLEIAEDFDLRQASLQRLGRTWYRQVTSTEGQVIMIAAGPRHTGPMPEGRRRDPAVWTARRERAPRCG